MNQALMEIAEKAAAAWRGTAQYHQAAEVIDMLVVELKTTSARAEEYAKAQQAGRLVVLPCKVERIKETVQNLQKSYGCLYDDIGLPNEYGDCRKGCWRCIIDGLRMEAEAALKSAP